jgi:GNAT superfamily N-acetyltransferase
MEGFEYRRAGIGDVGALVDLRIEFMRIVKDGGLPDEEAWRRELAAVFARDLGSGRLVAWICVEGGRAIAAGGLALPAAGALSEAAAGRAGARGPRRSGLVMNMYTAPDRRRRGIGAELLRLAIEEARAAGLPSLRLRPTQAGRGIYLAAGFCARGGHGGDMELAL